MNFDSLPKKYITREIEEKLFKFLNDREILAIRGPRQSGKTTLLFKIGQHLKKTHGKNSVVYLSFEDELEKTKFVEDPAKYLQFYFNDKKRVFFLFDEVQYLENGGKILKLLFDRYPWIKFIVTGSSTLDINKLGKFLVGRCLFFELYPFSFAEFLKTKNSRLWREYQNNRFSFKQFSIVDSLHKDKLTQHLKEYLTFGGYPRVVLEKNLEKKLFLAKNLFTTYLEKDISGLYGLKHKQKSIDVLKYLASAVGSLINFNDICQATNCHFQELKEILQILEQTYIIQKLTPFHKNLITELKKNPKYYFLDTGLKNTLINRFKFSPEEWGQLLENYGFLALKNQPINFWRTTAKAEVDFVIKALSLPVETKNTAKISRSFMSFLKTYRPDHGLIINWENASKRTIGKTQILAVPACLI